MAYALTPNVEVIQADISLSTSILSSLPDPAPSSRHSAYARKNARSRKPAYYITSDILLHLFAFEQYFDRVVIMVQREVADRLVAKPGGSEYGLLSLRRSSMREWKAV